MLTLAARILTIQIFRTHLWNAVTEKNHNTDEVRFILKNCTHGRNKVEFSLNFPVLSVGKMSSMYSFISSFFPQLCENLSLLPVALFVLFYHQMVFHCMTIPQFTRSAVDGHLRSFQFWLYTPPPRTLVCMSFGKYLCTNQLGIYLGVECLGHWTCTYSAFVATARQFIKWLCPAGCEVSSCQPLVPLLCFLFCRYRVGSHIGPWSFTPLMLSPLCN